MACLWQRSAFEATPILYDGTLYWTTSSTDVIAVDAVNGRLRWRHESHSRRDLHYSDGVSRGVPLWVNAAVRLDAACYARIYAPTLDGRLLALDAVIGSPCEDFGEHGAVNLLKDMRSQDEAGDEWRNYLVTSPPVYAQWNTASLRTASAANAWAPLSVDVVRHLVYVPTGSAAGQCGRLQLGAASHSIRSVNWLSPIRSTCPSWWR